MPRLLRTLCLSSVLICVSCGTRSTETQYDPLSDYKDFIRQELERIRTGTKKLHLNDDYEIDVKKTDSLVSPYLATCEVLSEVQEGTPELLMLATFELKITHAYQEKKWVFRRGLARYTDISVVKDNTPGKTGERIAEQMMAKSREFEFDSIDKLIQNFK